MAKTVKIQIPGKIYFNGFTRQLKELYYLLSYEGYIACDIDEFFTHFTGKKFTPTEKPKVKLEWNEEKYLIALLVNHLIEKRFLDDDIMKTHFTGVSDAALNQYNENKNSASAKKLQILLNNLFPATSGYRCKERLFYKARNKEPQIAVLENCGIKVPL
jgi:hypothetical protein